MLTQCSSWGAVFCIVQPCLKVSLSAPRSLPLSRFTGAPPADGTPTYDSLKGESNPVGRIESKWANRIQLGESNPVGRNRIQLGEIESSWQNLRGAIGLPRSRREATTHKVPRHLQRARRLPCRPRVRGARRGAADGGGKDAGAGAAPGEWITEHHDPPVSCNCSKNFRVPATARKNSELCFCVAAQRLN